jgi:D-glycero-D-manno-heptose 1,7-bisphosphate phosphatase
MVIISVTNQAGIERGFFTERQFHALTDWASARFADEGMTIDQVRSISAHTIQRTVLVITGGTAPAASQILE